MTASIIHTLSAFLKNLSLDRAIRIERQNGIPIFCVSQQVQNRIETILDKSEETTLTKPKEQEIDSYAEIDNYLSFVNRIIRNNLL